MRGTTTLLQAVCAAALLAGATPAFAQDDTTSALLLRLKEKGILTQAEYDDLIARKPPAAPPAPQPAAVATNPTAEPQTAAVAQLDDKRLVRMTSSGIGMEVGGVTVKFSGSVNAFYTHDSPDKRLAGTTVVGGLANTGPQNSSAIRNGLLPGIFGLDVSTNQGGWDIAAHFGFYPRHQQQFVRRQWCQRRRCASRAGDRRDRCPADLYDDRQAASRHLQARA